jgi:hypothetical protein
MILSVAFKSQNSFCIILFCVTWLFCCATAYFFNKNVNIFLSMYNIVKLITIPFFYIYFSISIEFGEKVYVNKFRKIMNINSLVFLGNIIIGVFGFGYYTYASAKFGIKGFFFAGNEVSMIFFCLFYYFLSKTTCGGKYILFIYIIAMIIATLIGTKTGFIASCLLSIIDYYFRLTKYKKIFFIFCFPALIFIFLISAIVFLRKTEFYEFISYRILVTPKRSENILNILLSGRIGYFNNNYHIWIEKFTLSTFLFGLGDYLTKNVEIDFFDTLFNCGIIYLLLTLYFYLFIIYVSWKKSKKRLFFFNLIYFFISFTAGHVWFSVMAGLFFVYLNVYETNNFGYFKSLHYELK